MPTIFTDVNNPNELNTRRASTTVKTHGATTTYVDNTGSATTDFAYHGGASQSYTMMETKEFNPNNMSSLTQNDSFATVGHDAFQQVHGMKETRVFGDFNIITGSPNFFTDGLASSYIQKRSEIPCGPETADEAYGNVSGAKYESKSAPDPHSGSTVGKTGSSSKKTGKSSTPPEPAVQNRADVLPLIQEDLTKIEKNMGVGGSVKIMSCRHLLLQAGASTSTMDSAIIKPKGREYDAPFSTAKKEKGAPNAKSGKGKPSTNITEPDPQTAGPQIETVETTANMPFGNIQIRPGNSFDVAAGTGGISLFSGGTNSIGGMGQTNIHSPGVLVQGSQCLDLKSGSNVKVEGSQLNVVVPESIIKGNVHIRGNVIIQGNLHVEGNFTVGGTAEMNQTLAVTGGITSFDDVYTPKVTLNTHKHPQVSGNDMGGGPNTKSSVR